MAELPEALTPIMEADNLCVRAGAREILRAVKFSLRPQQAFGLVGPSGVGKSTLLKCLNRLVELTPQLQVSGEVRFHGQSIYAPGVDVDSLRERIGIIFQQPVIFPQSIERNVLFGVRHLGRIHKREWTNRAERALREAALWDEVKDRLGEAALRLSVGQQQRLCLARTLAVDPEVILLDEPTSALDPKSAEAVEDLLVRLKAHRTLVLVTHNLRQAQRVCDRIGCLLPRNDAGVLAAADTMDALFQQPQPPDVAAYLRKRD